MRFVPPEGASVREVERLARARTNWDGMERWGYVTIAPDPEDRRARPPRAEWIVRATPEGREAREIWRPLGEEIEERWRMRFGEHPIARIAFHGSAVVEDCRHRGLGNPGMVSDIRDRGALSGHSVPPQWTVQIEPT